jgi:multiple sugar transport system ATP-binding protein
MSISDQIVVMKNGVVHQIGKPQEVYDDPINLFVSKFLGTPPINVFEGRVKGGRLFIGDEAVLDVSGAKDGDVWAGIRPEGFIPDAGGPLTCRLLGVEVMGRDISVVCAHEKHQSPQIRAIISAETAVDPGAQVVRFSLKPWKVHLFDRATEARIRFDAGEKGAARHGR